MLDRPLAQPTQNGSLSILALFAQRLIHVAALFSFRGQSRCRTQICLVSKHHEKFYLLAIGSMLNYPRRDLPVERVVLNALAAWLPKSFVADICASSEPLAIVFGRSRSTLIYRTRRRHCRKDNYTS